MPPKREVISSQILQCTLQDRVGELRLQGCQRLWPTSPSTTTFTQTSLVLTMAMAIAASANDWKMRAATPVWLFMPTPWTDNLATRAE